MALWIEIFLVAFAVFGLFCALRTLSDALFLSAPVCVAVRVFDKDALASLEIMLEEAKGLLPGNRSSIVVLFDAALLGDDGSLSSPVRALLERFDAVCYIVRRTDRESRFPEPS